MLVLLWIAVLGYPPTVYGNEEEHFFNWQNLSSR